MGTVSDEWGCSHNLTVSGGVHAGAVVDLFFVLPPYISHTVDPMRIRTIKPAFFKDEKLASFPFHTAILFQGLWCLADGLGRLEYRPMYIKAEVFPYHAVDVEEVLKTLETAGFIQIYKAGGRPYIYVVNFHKHQRISGKEAALKSEFPPPPRRREATGKHRGSTCEAPVKQRGSTGEVPVVQERKGREGKGKEGKGDTGAKNAPAVIKGSDLVTTLTPQAEFVERFKSSYESMTGEPFKMDKHHFVIAADLIKKHGYEATVLKAKTLGALCRDRSAWFTKGGWADYTIEKLSSQWNSILPDAAPRGKEEEFLTELKRQEDLSARASQTIS